VIIVAFNLNDREAYFSERAEKICHLFMALEKIHKCSDDSDLDLAQLAISHLTSEKSPHANCTRSFKRLYENDRDRALKIKERIKKYLRSGS
jgi:hypothetical protein